MPAEPRRFRNPEMPAQARVEKPTKAEKCAVASSSGHSGPLHFIAPCIPLPTHEDLCNEACQDVPAARHCTEQCSIAFRCYLLHGDGIPHSDCRAVVIRQHKAEKVGHDHRQHATSPPVCTLPADPQRAGVQGELHYLVVTCVQAAAAIEEGLKEWDPAKDSTLEVLIQQLLLCLHACSS